MVEVAQIDLQGKIRAFGPVRFVRAEWWAESPKFVLLRYSVQGQERPKGVRLDLDKRSILDDFEGTSMSNEIRESAVMIWDVVIKAKAAATVPAKVATTREPVAFN